MSWGFVLFGFFWCPPLPQLVWVTLSWDGPDVTPAVTFGCPSLGATNPGPEGTPLSGAGLRNWLGTPQGTAGDREQLGHPRGQLRHPRAQLGHPWADVSSLGKEHVLGHPRAQLGTPQGTAGDTEHSWTWLVTLILLH